MSHPVKPILPGDAANIHQIRAICMALPEANERLSHGEPTWFAGKGKVFAMLDNHHHGANHLAVCLPQPMGAQEALIEMDSKRFFRPPYVGPSGWVGVVLDSGTNWKEVEALVRDAYLHVAGIKLRAKLLDDADVAPIAKRIKTPARKTLPKAYTSTAESVATKKKRPRG
ncbi:MAG: MmcQ/YjbR family DNA-binding protein [Polyangiaceae bacterium]|nr:MmcQ/YjbR family DNA-binding protein [Polyangiaceae bacterium]